MPKRTREEIEAERQERLALLRDYTGYDWVAEYKLFPKRRFMADFALPEHKIYIEVDGAVFVGGRHTRGKGFISDQEKRNLALIDGWKPVHCVPTTFLKQGIGTALCLLGLTSNV